MSNRCYMCKEEEEMIDHIILHCLKNHLVAIDLYFFFLIEWVMHSSVRNALLIWYGSFIKKNIKKGWRAAPLYLFGDIWKKRNRTFNKNADQTIKQTFMYNCLEWVRVYIGDYSLSIVNFTD